MLSLGSCAGAIALQKTTLHTLHKGFLPGWLASSSVSDQHTHLCICWKSCPNPPSLDTAALIAESRVMARGTVCFRISAGALFADTELTPPSPSTSDAWLPDSSCRSEWRAVDRLGDSETLPVSCFCKLSEEVSVAPAARCGIWANPRYSLVIEATAIRSAADEGWLAHASTKSACQGQWLLVEHSQPNCKHWPLTA